MNGVIIDLNVPLKALGMTRMIARAEDLGYQGIAFNECINVHEIKLWKPSTVPASVLSGKSLKGKSHVRNQLRFPSAHMDLCLPSNPTMEDRDFHVLRRVTIVIGDGNKTKDIQRFGDVLSAADLIAVRPTNQAVLVKLLETVQFDILSLDFTSREFLTIKRHLVAHIVKRGVMVEICLANLIDEELGSEKHTAFVRSLSSLVRFVPPSQIILTSGAQSPLKMRSPHEFLSLAHVLGLQTLTTTKLMRDNVMTTLYKSATRRATAGAVLSYPSPEGAPLSNTDDVEMQ